MLFQVTLKNPHCSVFTVLNNEFLYFIKKSSVATKFGVNLFPKNPDPQGSIPSALWSNKATRAKFKKLWEEIQRDPEEWKNYSMQVLATQDIHLLFSDKRTEPPRITNKTIDKTLKDLTKHLYSRAKSLREFSVLANETIGQHYLRFTSESKCRELCHVCGTSSIGQKRKGVPDIQQWRSDYDHILCKDLYPAFGVHPGNLIPICHICNSKAKLAKDILFGSDGYRRLAFYPFPPAQESCHSNVSVCFDIQTLADSIKSEHLSPFKKVSLKFSSTSNETLEKIRTWDEVYLITSRVEHHLISMIFDRLASDLIPNSFDDFKTQLERHSTGIPPDIFSSEWRIWWHKAYLNINSLHEDELKVIWDMVRWKIETAKNQNLQSVFGI